MIPDDETLIDYLFGLTDKSTTEAVKNSLKRSQACRKRLEELRLKFRLLDKAAPKTLSPSLFLIPSFAAAILFLVIFFQERPIAKETAIHSQTNTVIEYFEIKNQHHFSTLPETYTLMTILPSPLHPEEKFKIPEVRFFRDEEPASDDFTFVFYENENNPKEKPLEFYCTLKLTN